MKAEILKIIEDLYNEKTKTNSFPISVLDIELHKAVKNKVIEIIRELWKEGKIDIGRTIKNNFIQIRTTDSPKRNLKIVLHKITND